MLQVRPEAYKLSAAVRSSDYYLECLWAVDTRLWLCRQAHSKPLCMERLGLRDSESTAPQLQEATDKPRKQKHKYKML